LTFGLPELWLLESDRSIKDKLKKTCPAVDEGRMCAAGPPFVGKGYACRAERTLSILTDQHSLRISGHRGDPC
jgi:hypothetical protein